MNEVGVQRPETLNTYIGRKMRKVVDHHSSHAPVEVGFPDMRQTFDLGKGVSISQPTPSISVSD
jgi:hypothetical protein